MSSLSRFRTEYFEPVKPFKYKVRINSNGSFLAGVMGETGINRRLEYLCENAETPGKSLNTNDYQYYGPSFKSPNQVVFGDFSTTYLVTRNLDERLFFERWLEYISGSVTGYDFNFKDEYATQIDVLHYSEKANADTDKEMCKFSLIKAFPVNVNPMQLSWSEDGVQRLQVQFAYEDYIAYSHQDIQ